MCFRAFYIFNYMLLCFQMKAGSLVNILCVLVVTLATFTWGMAYFEFDSVPWANDTVSATTITAL